MALDRTSGYLTDLVGELRKLPREVGWVEFKESYANPEDVGQYISALANTATLQGASTAYLVWGIEDGTHAVVGTAFRPHAAKKGNEALESWLARLLDPRVYFQFHEITYDGKPVVVLEIAASAGRPVQFQGVEYVRVGSHRQQLKDHPELARALWRSFEDTPFERTHVAEHLPAAEVLELLDWPSYFALLKLPTATDPDAVLARFADDGLVTPCDAGGWNVTALGAALFARNLDAFGRLKRKAVRVVVYDGRSRVKTRREQDGRKGYAAGFESLVAFLGTILPRNEVIGRALRREVPMYPDLAVRELVANALVHQDFLLTGAGPMIEVFDDRMEITNPGRPLVSTDRFLDTPPRSRNEALASFMRRVGICEERGSGIDKVVLETEIYQLPAPIFETTDDATRAVLFGHKQFREMDRDDRVRACYLHACLRYVQREHMTNASLRQRFGIEERNSAVASRIIADAIQTGWVKPFDPAQGKKYAKYIPIWA